MIDLVIDLDIFIASCPWLKELTVKKKKKIKATAYQTRHHTHKTAMDLSTPCIWSKVSYNDSEKEKKKPRKKER